MLECPSGGYLALHRRQLTKEQKKEIAANLREQGWTQERIGKALRVTQQTISNWIPLQKFVNQNSDNSSPPTPTENLEKHGFSQGEDYEVFHKIVKNPQGGHSPGLRSKERRGGVLAADQRKSAQNAAEAQAPAMRRKASWNPKR